MLCPTSVMPSLQHANIYSRRTFKYLVLINRTIYRNKGIKHIMVLMNFGKTDSITGKQLRASLESTKMELGSLGPLFMNNYPSLSNCITDTWISNTWKLLLEYNLFLEVKTANLETQRLNDYFIVDTFLQEVFERYDLAELNICRVFLKSI